MSHRLLRRLERLEAKRPSRLHTGPSVILLCEAKGEAKAALLIGGGSCPREPSETEADFIARANRNAYCTILLPDNGRG